MNATVYQAARQAGCPPREAEVLAVYVESVKVLDAALKLGISEQTAKNHLQSARRRLGVKSTRQAVVKLVA